MSKTTPSKQIEDITDAEYVKLALSEINQSIAYLSKMLVELQKTVNSSKAKKNRAETSQEDSCPTIH